MTNHDFVSKIFLLSTLALLAASLTTGLYVIIPDNTAVLPTGRVIPLLYIGGASLSGQNVTLSVYRKLQNKDDILVSKDEVSLPGSSGYVPWMIPENATQSCAYYVCLNPVNQSLITDSSLSCYSVGGFYCAVNAQTSSPRRPYITLDYPQQYTKWTEGKNFSVVYSQFFGNGQENGAQGSFSLGLTLWKNSITGADTAVGEKHTYVLDKSKPYGELEFPVPTGLAYNNMYYVCGELLSNEVGVDQTNNGTNQADEGTCFAKSGLFSISPGNFNISAPVASAQWQFNTTQYLEFSEDLKFNQFSVSVFQIRDQNREYIVDDVRLINVNQAVAAPRTGKIPFNIIWGGALQTTPGCTYFICVNPVFVGPYTVRCLVRSETFCISGGQSAPVPVPQQQQGQQQGPPQQGAPQQGPPQQGPPQQQGAPQQQGQQQQGPPQQQQMPQQKQTRSILPASIPNTDNNGIPVSKRVLYYGQHPSQYHPFGMQYQIGNYQPGYNMQPQFQFNHPWNGMQPQFQQFRRF